MEAIGLDMGIANQVTCSNGIQIKYRVPVTKRLKKRHKEVSRKEKRSKNRWKARIRLQKEHAKAVNIKENISNQLVALLCMFAKRICVQNDSVKGWQQIWGKRLLETSIGGFLGKLKKLPDTIVVERFFASSQMCPICKEKTKHNLAQREFVCGVCGHVDDRDVNAAKNLLREGLSMVRIGTEHTESLEEMENSMTSIYACGHENLYMDA